MSSSNNNNNNEKLTTVQYPGQAYSSDYLDGAIAFLIAYFGRKGYSKTATIAIIGLLLKRLNRAPFHPISSKLFSPFVSVPGCEIGGTTVFGYEKVRDAFIKSFQDGQELGSQVCIYVNDECKVNLWGRQLNHETTKNYGADTLQIVFSSTKNMTAIATAICIDRKWIENYDDKVSKYWPEFAQHGKESISIADVLRHDAGLWCLDEQMTVEESCDPIKSANKMAAERLHYDEIDPNMDSKEKPRQYHGLTRGFILAEIIRRVDPQNRFIGKFVHEEICVPLGVEFYIGPIWNELNVQKPIAPMTQADGDILSNAVFNALFAIVGATVPLAEAIGVIKPNIGTLIRDQIDFNVYGKVTGAFAKIWSLDTNVNNNARWDPTWFNEPNKGLHDAQIGSGNGISAARNMAKIAACISNGGEIDDVRILQPETVKMMLGGIVEKSMFGIPMPFSRGGFGAFPGMGGASAMRGGGSSDAVKRMGKENSFYGWGGWGGSMWLWTNIDSKHRIGFSYTMNAMANQLLGSNRTTRITDAFAECLIKESNSSSL